MSKPILEYSAFQPMRHERGIERPGIVMLWAYLVVLVCVNNQVCRRAVATIDWDFANYCGYIVGPAINGLAGLVLLLTALIMHARRGASLSTGLCLIFAAALPITVVFVDAAWIGSFFGGHGDKFWEIIG